MTTSTRWRVRAAAIVAAWWVLQPLQAAPAGQGAAPAADVVAVLMKASSYLAGYVKALSSVVSEERYEQILIRRGFSLPTSGRTTTRVLVSDYLLVAVASTGDWMPFRDVYSVDGVPIRDRSDRLLRLFVEAPPDAYKQALRIRDESSRYNLGSGTRDINVPTFAFHVLNGERRGGFTFVLKGRERLGETDSVVVEYLETASPTLVVGWNNKDIPSRGRFWVDPADGRILRTLFETRPSGTVNTLEVRFRHEPKLELLVPDEMIERRDGGAESLEGRATYTNFRRFRVDTSMEIK